MATSVAECERMLRARDEAERTLMIAYRAHFEPYNLNAIARIGNGAKVRTPGEMGIRDVRIIEAIYASVREGVPVRLRPDGSRDIG